MAGRHHREGAEIRDTQLIDRRKERGAANAADTRMGRLRVTKWERGRDVDQSMRRVVVKLIRRRHGSDRRRRGHEQVMPEQRQDDKKPLEPE